MHVKGNTSIYKVGNQNRSLGTRVSPGHQHSLTSWQRLTHPGNTLCLCLLSLPVSSGILCIPPGQRLGSHPWILLLVYILHPVRYQVPFLLSDYACNPAMQPPCSSGALLGQCPHNSSSSGQMASFVCASDHMPHPCTPCAGSASSASLAIKKKSRFLIGPVEPFMICPLPPQGMWLPIYISSPRSYRFSFYNENSRR